MEAADQATMANLRQSLANTYELVEQLSVRISAAAEASIARVSTAVEDGFHAAKQGFMRNVPGGGPPGEEGFEIGGPPGQRVPGVDFFERFGPREAVQGPEIDAAMNIYNPNNGAYYNDVVQPAEGGGNHFERMIMRFYELDNHIRKLIRQAVEAGNGMVTQLEQARIELAESLAKRLTRLNKMRQDNFNAEQIGKFVENSFTAVNDARIEAQEAMQEYIKQANEIAANVRNGLPTPKDVLGKFQALGARVQKFYNEGRYMHKAHEFFQENAASVAGGIVGTAIGYGAMEYIDPNRRMPKFQRLIVQGTIAGSSTNVLTSAFKAGGQEFLREGATVSSIATEARAGLQAGMNAVNIAEGAAGGAVGYVVQGEVTDLSTKALLAAGATQDAADAGGQTIGGAAGGAASAYAAGVAADIAVDAGIGVSIGVGAAEGAEVGTAGGPPGIVIGAIVGAILGFGSWLVGKAIRSGQGPVKMEDYPMEHFGYVPAFHMGSPDTYRKWLSEHFPPGTRVPKAAGEGGGDSGKGDPNNPNDIRNVDTKQSREEYMAWVQHSHDAMIEKEDALHKAQAQQRALYFAPKNQGMSPATPEELYKATGQQVVVGEQAGYDGKVPREQTLLHPCDQARLAATKQPALKQMMTRYNASYHGFVTWMKNNASSWLKLNAPGNILAQTMVEIDGAGYQQVTSMMEQIAATVDRYVKSGMKHVSAVKSAAQFMGIPMSRVNDMIQVSKGARRAAHFVLDAKNQSAIRQEQFDKTNDETTIAGRMMNLLATEVIDLSAFQRAMKKKAQQALPTSMRIVAQHMLDHFPKVVSRPSGILTMNDVQDMIVCAAGSIMLPLYKGSDEHMKHAGKKKDKEDCVCELLEELIKLNKQMLEKGEMKKPDLDDMRETLPVEAAAPPSKRRRFIPGREGALTAEEPAPSRAVRFDLSHIRNGVRLHPNMAVPLASVPNDLGIRLRV
jgi:uncharacterized protein YdcH (DUF465 family)